MNRSLIGTLSICVATALLAGCGESQPPIAARGATSNGTDSLPYHKTFKYTGKEQTFAVPPGVTSITVVARGAAGGGIGPYRSRSGLGSRVQAVLPVIPGETLYVFVGGAGFYDPSDGDFYGGFNGGGNAGRCCEGGEGGGGASDIREGGDQISGRILVAGGGGGQGGFTCCGGDGGAGGPRKGDAGKSGLYEGITNGRGGKGGTQTAGGRGGKRGQSGGYGSGPGKPGASGHLGRGGAGGYGGSGFSSDSYGGSGGGGGGGYYGGGGGGGGAGGEIDGSGGGGGGGGSSYVEPSALRSKMWRGWKNATGNGLIVLSWATH